LIQSFLEVRLAGRDIHAAVLVRSFNKLQANARSLVLRVMERMEDRHSWVLLKFVGELLLLGLATLWFMNQPQFEPAIVMLAFAGSIVMRIVTRKTHRTAFAVLAVIMICGVLIYGVRRRSASRHDLSTTETPVGPAHPLAAIQTGLKNSDYLLIDDGSRLLKKALERTTLLELRNSANAGNREAQYLLGIAYRAGEGFVADDKLAVRWFREAAKQGFARGQFAYGLCLLEGSGVPQNKADGITWMTAADKQGVAGAAISLGRAYHAGDGVPKNVERASGYYEKALDLGYPEAGYWLAALFFEKADEANVQDDLANYGRHRKKALDYLLWSAERGVTISQNRLGEMYQWGIYVPKDLKVAVKWYRTAANGWLVDPYISLAQLLEEGAGGIKPDFNEALRYWRAASEKGSSVAKVELAARIQDGKLQPAFPTEFVTLCEAALAEGSVRAAHMLAGAYWNGKGTARNPAFAARYAVAAFNLGSKAEPSSDDAFPMYAVNAAHILQDVQRNGVAIPSGVNIDQLKVRYGPPQPLKKLNVKVTCHTVTVDAEIYIWDWGRKESPTEMQFDWLSKARRCEPKPEARKGLKDIYDIAQQRRTSYKELLVEALSETGGWPHARTAILSHP
jgi:TPR repeat protein